MANTKSIGGWHPDPEIRKTYKVNWPPGSIFENEGEKLYQMIRKLKPDLIIEVGAFYGCSTAWIAKAVKDNKKGRFISIDINAGSHSLLPDEYRPYVEIVHDDVFNFEIDEKVDFLFEDGEHSLGFSRRVIEKFSPAIAVSHDYFHPNMRKTVKVDWDSMGGPDETFFEKPSDCGLAIKYNNLPGIKVHKKCKSCG